MHKKESEKGFQMVCVCVFWKYKFFPVSLGFVCNELKGNGQGNWIFKHICNTIFHMYMRMFSVFDVKLLMSKSEKAFILCQNF